MVEFDKTKKNLGIDQLEEDDRKKLFKDFIAAGGKVDTPPKRSALTIDRVKQAEYKNKLESHQKTKTHTSKATPHHGGDSKVKMGNIGIALKMKTAFHLFFAGVTGLNAVFLKDSFFRKMFNEYRSALEDLQKVYMYIFELNQTAGKSVTLKLDSEKPLFLELIAMASGLYQKEYYKELSENYNTLPKTLSHHRDGFLYLMKKICVLKPYENAILNSYLKALDYYVHFSGDKARHSEYRNAVKNSLFLILNKLYYQLYWLTVRYTGQDPKYDFTQLYKILGISDSEKPGSRTTHGKHESHITHEKSSEKADSADHEEPGEESKDAKDSKDAIKEKVDELSDGVKTGLKLMSKINMTDLISNFNPDRLFSDMSENDRVDKTFKTFLLFAEFEREYSFILSSGKIKYNVYFTSSGKINYGKQLQDIYALMQKPWNAFKDFKAEHQDYDLLSQEKPAGNQQQYMNHVNKLKDMSKNIQLVSQKSRSLVYDFLQELFTILEELQKDLKSDCRLISNPQEALYFDTRIEGPKKLAGVKVFEAVNIITSYVEAFIFRLSRNGDLYGLPSEESTPQDKVVDRVMSNDEADTEEKPEPLDDYGVEGEEAAAKEANEKQEANIIEKETTTQESNKHEEPDKPQGSDETKDTKEKKGADAGGSIFNELDDLL